MPKKGGKKKGKQSETSEKRPLILKEEMQEYAKIMNTLGDRRMSVILPDSTEILAVIPGRFRKRCWMSVGDIVLISRRDFQDNRVDIIHKYKTEELRKLLKLNEIPAFFLEADATGYQDESCIMFENEMENESKDFDFDDI